MHQSPLKNLPRQRDRQADFDPAEKDAQRRSDRASASKSRRFQLDEDSPRAQRLERRPGPSR